MISRSALGLLVGLALPTIALAQAGDDLVPAPPSTYLAEPAAGVPLDLRPPSALDAPASRWPEPASSVAQGIRDPVRTTVPDDGIVLTGIGFFLGAYLSGLLLTSPFVAVGGGEKGFAAFGLVPFAQWAVGFYDSRSWGASTTIFITGGIFAFWQVLGTLILVGGLADRREAIGPSERGEIALSADGIEVAF